MKNGLRRYAVFRGDGSRVIRRVATDNRVFFGVVDMNFLVAVMAFLLGAVSLIVLEVNKLDSFLDGFRDLFNP